MTDLEKAKQWRAVHENEFIRELNGERAFDYDAMLAAYASHSNSELLERVQKLEQALTEIRDHSLTFDVDEIRYIAIEGLAKAPETRNV